MLTVHLFFFFLIFIHFAGPRLRCLMEELVTLSGVKPRCPVLEYAGLDTGPPGKSPVNRFLMLTPYKTLY